MDDLVKRLRAGTHIRDDFWLNPLPLALEAAADKARAVSDEELRSLARMAAKFGDDWIAALHAGGLKVVRA